MKSIIALSIVLLLLTGGLGLKTKEMCNNDPDISGDTSKLMQCYYSAAITWAYLDEPNKARDTCSSVLALASGYTQDSDIRKKAQLLTLNCYFDVAKALARSDPVEANNTCDYIIQQDTVGTKLVGADVTQQACYDEVYRLSLAGYTSANNFCSIIFVLPLLAFASLKSVDFHRPV